MLCDLKYHIKDAAVQKNIARRASPSRCEKVLKSHIITSIDIKLEEYRAQNLILINDHLWKISLRLFSYTKNFKSKLK